MIIVDVVRFVLVNAWKLFNKTHFFLIHDALWYYLDQLQTLFYRQLDKLLEIVSYCAEK